MAATDSFTLIVRGHGGHAAKPQETVDPVLIAAHIITGLQSLVSRETDPLDQAVISVTAVHGGTAHNIIPESVELRGTLRTFLKRDAGAVARKNRSVRAGRGAESPRRGRVTLD